MKGCGRKIGPFDCCTVVLGDSEKCLRTIPPDCIDLVVTDPPYGMSLKLRQSHNKRIHGDDKPYPEKAVKALIKIPRLGSYFFCRWDNLWEHTLLPKPKSVVAWLKVEGGGTGDCKHEHIRDYEMAMFYPGREHRFRHRPSDVTVASRTGNHLHTTQKPVGLIKQMLEWYDFETVLDPYMGHGATGRAAKELGKHFLGFEIDEGHYKQSVHFIERDVMVMKDVTQQAVTPLLDIF